MQVTCGEPSGLRVTKCASDRTRAPLTASGGISTALTQRTRSLVPLAQARRARVRIERVAEAVRDEVRADDEAWRWRCSG